MTLTAIELWIQIAMTVYSVIAILLALGILGKKAWQSRGSGDHLGDLRFMTILFALSLFVSLVWSFLGVVLPDSERLRLSTLAIKVGLTVALSYGWAIWYRRR